MNEKLCCLVRPVGSCKDCYVGPFCENHISEYWEADMTGGAFYLCDKCARSSREYILTPKERAEEEHRRTLSDPSDESLEYVDEETP